MEFYNILKAVCTSSVNIFDFHFTDNQGMEMEGPVEYRGRLYNVVISALDSESYYRQIAKQIMEQRKNFIEILPSKSLMAEAV